MRNKKIHLWRNIFISAVIFILATTICNALFYRAVSMGSLDRDIAGTLAAMRHKADVIRMRQARKAEDERRKASAARTDNEIASGSRKKHEPVRISIASEPVLPPPPSIIRETIKQQYHISGAVMPVQECIPIQAENAEWGKKHLPGKTVYITLFDADGKHIGDEQKCIINNDMTAAFIIPSEGFEVSSKDIERVLTRSYHQTIMPVKKNIRFKKKITSKNLKIVKNSSRDTTGNKLSDSTIGFAPQEIALTIKSRVAVLNVKLDSSLANEFEIKSNGVQCFPELKNDMIHRSEIKTSFLSEPIKTPIRLASMRMIRLYTRKKPGKNNTTKMRSRQKSLSTRTNIRSLTNRIQDITMLCKYVVNPSTDWEPVTLRRTIADFVVKTTPDVALEFGGEKIGGDSYKDGAYRFQCPTSQFNVGSLSMEVSRELPGGTQEGTSTIPFPDPYQDNILKAPALRLVKINNMELDGFKATAENSNIPCGVFATFYDDWKSVKPDGLPDLNDRKNKKLGKIVIPHIKDDRGRFGEWYLYKDAGIWLHLREIKPMINKNPAQIAVEDVRLETPEAGQVGGIKVGMTREEVHNLLGEPDSAAGTTFDIFASDFKDTNKAEPQLLEAADESYMDNGICLKYTDNRVSWIEIRRTTPLLLQGTTAFVQPERKKIFIDDQTRNGDYDGKQYLKKLIEYAGVCTETKIKDEADYVLKPRFTLSHTIVQVPHTELVKQVAYDSNGNPRYDKNGKVITEEVSKTRHMDDDLEVKTDLVCEVDAPDEQGNFQPLTTISGYSIASSMNLFPQHTVNDAPIHIQESDVPRLISMMNLDGNMSSRSMLVKEFIDLCDMCGRVTSVDYKNNALSVNLGKEQGIRAKDGGQPTEMDIYVRTGDERDYTYVNKTTKKLYVVNQNSVGDDPAAWNFVRADVIKGEVGDADSIIKYDQLEPIGEKIAGWAEVQEVSDNSCIVALKKKDDMGRTKNDFKALQRIPDASLGLTIARVRIKGGDVQK